MAPIGIMQGRLSPPLEGRIQAFPVDTWKQEFELAAAAGLACIEWVYEAPNEDRNPLSNEAGIERVRACATASGVAVSSICADYYMHVHLIADGRPVPEVVAHAAALVERSARLGVRYVVLPFVDESRLETKSEREALVEVVRLLLPAAERAHVELHLETDFPAVELARLLAEVDHPLVRANYDIGNAASLGLAPAAELPVLGPWVASVHVKDRVEGGGTVALGEGDADLPTTFALLRVVGFSGPYILQVARAPGLSELELARRNRMAVERLLVEAAA